MSNTSTSFQLLACQVEINHEDPALSDPFRYLATLAQQPLPIRKTLSYEVSGTGPYDIAEEGDPLDRVQTSADVIHVIYGRTHRRTLERFVLSGWVVLHGAVATIGDRRTLILGDKGAGKTTLATSLLYAGHQVEGDEMALVRDGQVLTLPRTFHLKPGIDRNVPQLSGQVEDLPAMYAGQDRISALDPSELGFDWKISIGTIDRVVWIKPNHGGETRLEPTPVFTTIQHLLEASLGWGENREVLVAAVTKLAATGGFQLTLGDPENAINHLEEIAR